MFRIIYTDRAALDVQRHTNAGLKRRIDFLICQLQTHPFSGGGEVETLKHTDGRKLFSRRIDRRHRLVYSVDETEMSVCILSAYGHYF